MSYIEISMDYCDGDKRKVRIEEDDLVEADCRAFCRLCFEALTALGFNPKTVDECMVSEISEWSEVFTSLDEVCEMLSNIVEGE